MIFSLFRRSFLLSSAILAAACANTAATGLEQIQTIVVIYAENRSFDHLYGLFPGANGLAQANDQQKTQLDHDGRPLAQLPPVYDCAGKADARFPQGRRARSTISTRTASRSTAAATTCSSP